MVQGITGREGMFHAAQMLEYGTRLVAGVTPGKGGEWVFQGKVPVFDTVKLAVEATGADCSVVFVPARFAGDATMEAADAGIRLVIVITEGIPVQDMMQVRQYLDQKGVRLVGPNCPGVLTPGECKAGIIPGHVAIPGHVGVVFAIRNPDLRSALRAAAEEDGSLHVRRNWRRSNQWHVFCGCAGDV